MPSSQFEDEIEDGYEESDDTVPMPDIKQEPEYPGSPIAQKSVNSLSLQDAQELVAALTAISLKLGDSNKGTVFQINSLIARANVLDQEQREKIIPLMGELKALLLTSQEELKQCNKATQDNFQYQIKEVMSKVDFLPLKDKVDQFNSTIVVSVNELKTKIDELETIAARTKKIGFFSSVKFMVAGFALGTGLLFGMYQYKTFYFEQAKNDEFNAKWEKVEERFAVFKKLKDDQWNAVIIDNGGVKNIQIVVRDTTSQANSGRGFATDKNGKYQVSYFNIPIFK